jgi:hypothetical protein
MTSKRSYVTDCRQIGTLKYWEIGWTDVTSLGLRIFYVLWRWIVRDLCETEFKINLCRIHFEQKL